MNSFIDIFAIIIAQILDILGFCILGRALLSWVPQLRGSEIARILDLITEPIMEPIRKIVPPIGGTIDITPMLTMILLFIVSNFITAQVR